MDFLYTSVLRRGLSTTARVTFSSGSKILPIQQQLQNIKKRDFLIDDYLNKITKLMDDIKTVGINVSTFETILYILGGLDTDFEAMIAVISS